jgi:Ca2+-binding EF-hand superfamily protein
MLGKCQIVPALASAVHGAIEELPLLPQTPSPQLDRSRLTSSTSSSTTPAPTSTTADETRTPNYFQLSSVARPSLTTNGSLTSSYSRVPTLIDARKAFAYFDKNQDGKLSIKEFKSVMHDLGYKTVDKRCIRQMFAEADRNGNGRTLGLTEFVEFLESKLSLTTPNSTPASTQQQEASRPSLVNSAAGGGITTMSNETGVSLPKMQLDIETLFNCYDLDKNGFIEPKELRKVMKRLTGEKLSKQDIAEMMNVADRNGDGLLDKNEFALLCSAF